MPLELDFDPIAAIVSFYVMAASLAVEKPRVVQWSRPGGHLAQIFHPPTAWNEGEIWLLALVPPLVLVLAGWLAGHLRYGVYVSCAASVDSTFCRISESASVESGPRRSGLGTKSSAPSSSALKTFSRWA